MRGSVVSNVVQNIDLTASCLQWSGDGENPMREQLEGQPLPLSDAEHDPRKLAFSESMRIFERSHFRVLSELGLSRSGCVGVRSKTQKLIWNTEGEEEFYDLVNDPHEAQNLIAEAPAQLAELRAALKPVIPKFERSLETAVQRVQEPGRAVTDPALEQRLRDLGYLD
jgi:hypothetical protein